MTIIEFPLYREVDSLIIQYNLSDEKLDKPLVREAIFEIRKTHGIFREHHLSIIIQLLNHDWLPSDIPVLLPNATNF